MQIIRPIALGSIIVAGMLLLGCDVKFQRNSEQLQHLHQLRTPISPNEPPSPGQQGRQYDFEIARANFGGFMLPNVKRGEADEHVAVGLKRLDDNQWEFEHGRSKRFPESDLRHDRSRPVLRFADGQAIPYYGHLFRFSHHGALAHLEECTHQFPTELVPDADSRVLTLNQSEATFFHQRESSAGTTSQEESFETIQVVKIDSHREGIQATIMRKPMIARHVDGNEEIMPAGEPKQQRIGVGANLLIDDQLVRVKQIVPSGEVEGAGSLIGWVELEPVDLSEVEMHRALL